MKKSKLIIVLLLFSLIFVGGDRAVVAFNMDYLAPYAGISYNTFNIDGNSWEPEFDIELDDSANSALGFYLGSNYKLDNNFEGMSVGLEIDYPGKVKLKDGDVEATVSTFGFLGTVNYEVLKNINEMPLNFNLFGAAGLYRANFEMRDEIGVVVDNSYTGPGFKAGFQADYLIADKVAINARGNYRYANPHSGGYLDYSGIELGAGIELSF